MPVAVVNIASVIVHHAVSLLVVPKPQPVITVVVGEVVYALAVLLVLEPLPFVPFAIGEGIHSMPLPFAFHVLSLKGVAIIKACTAFAMGLSTKHFALIEPFVVRHARAKNYFL